VKPMTDRAKELNTQKYTQEAIERARSVADSFDEIFEGLNEKIPTMLNKPKEEAKKLVEKAATPVQAKAAPVAPKPVDIVTPPASEVVEKVAVVEKATPAPVPVPSPVMAAAAAPMEKTPAVEKAVVETKPKAPAFTTAWSNDLLKLQYSEKVIEDIRAADAVALERAHARRLGLGTLALATATTSTSMSTSTTEVSSTSVSKAIVGEVVTALNTSNRSFTKQRLRSALGISQQPEPELSEAPEGKKPLPWWIAFVLAMAAFALIAIIIRAMM
jgi:hypothetical protein